MCIKWPVSRSIARAFIHVIGAILVSISDSQHTDTGHGV